MRRRSLTSSSDDARARFRTEFGTALDAQLSGRRLTQTALGQATNRSVSYVNQTMTGAKGASPEWVDIVADATRATDEERERLHRAAARDRGYKVP